MRKSVKERSFRKATSIVCSLTLAASMCPAAGLAWATDGGGTSSDDVVTIGQAADGLDSSVLADAPSTDEAGTYLILSADDLKWFMNAATADAYAGNAKLTADIDLGTITTWYKAGGNTAANGYQGTFDGDGHTITLNYANSDSTQPTSLFNYIGTNGVVKNLTVAGSLSDDDTTRKAAAITDANYGTITNCVNRATIECSSSRFTIPKAAGVVVRNFGTIEKCANYGVIKAVSTSTSASAYAGGIVAEEAGVSGSTASVSVINCYNAGSVTATSTADGASKCMYAGGIAGAVGVTNKSYTFVFSSCVNAGTITASGSTTMAAGGIMGAAVKGYSTNNTVTMTNCYYDENSASALGNSVSATGSASTGAYTSTASGSATAANLSDATWLSTNVSDYMAETIATPVSESWYSPDAKELTIKTYDEMAEFAQIVNGTHESFAQDSFRGKTVTLAADIDMGGVQDEKGTWSGTSWTPVGNATYTYSSTATDSNYTITSGNAFEGTFDGAGHKLTNLYISSDKGYLGIFGAVGGTDTVGAAGYGTVKNFVIESGSVTCTNTSAQATDFVGVAVGKLNAGGTIEGIINYVDVYAPYTMCVGGIVGFAGTSVQWNQMSNNNRNVYLGNPSGDNTFVLRCANHGDIIGYYKDGGIVGENAAQVLYCYNTGTIEQGMSGSGGGIGGIAGRNGDRNLNYSEVGTIMYCYNTGTIKGTSPITSATIRGYGGITGWSSLNCLVANNYSAGVVEVGYSDYQAICGRGDSPYTGLENNYALDTLNDKYTTDADAPKMGIKKTSAELKQCANLMNVGARAFVADSATEPINDGYPILYWQSSSYDPNATITNTAWSGEDTVVTSYSAGLSFDTASLSFAATFSDGTQQTVTDFDLTIDGKAINDPLTKDDNGKTVVASTTLGGTTYSKEFKITVVPTTVTGITASSYYASPYRLVYSAGDTFNPYGLNLTVSYSNGKSETLSLYSPSTYAETWATMQKNGWSCNLTTITSDDNGKKPVLTYTYDGIAYTYEAPATISVIAKPSQDDQGNYLVNTVDDLKWVANEVEFGTSTEIGNNYYDTNISVKLMADIDLSGIEYKVIGDSVGWNSYCFNGTFDGNGHKITYSDTTTFKTNISGAGIIGILGTSGVVKDLTVEGSVAPTVNFGGIVFKMYGTNAKIENCTNNANINTTKPVGGIAYSVEAKATAGSIINCTNNGNVTSTTSSVGGIVGSTSVSTLSITGCTNNGTIQAQSNVGGIVGNGMGTIKNCLNAGSVVATSGKAGGIMGNCSNSSTTYGIFNCANTGDVTATQSAGGLVGGTYKSAYANSYNTGTITVTAATATTGAGGLIGVYDSNRAGATVTNCYNAGTIISNNDNAAALIGYDSKGAILANCYFVGDDKTSVWNGTAAQTTGYTAQTADKMKSAETITALGSDFKADGDGKTEYSLNGGYPILTWQNITPSALVGLKGDVNNNGKLNIVDAQITYDLSANHYEGDSLSALLAKWGEGTILIQVQKFADVNGDNALDAADARAIQYAVHNGGVFGA